MSGFHLHRFTLLTLPFLLAACSSSHVVDGARADASPLDVDDAGAAPHDASRPIPTRCAPELGDLVGDGCFCRGPLASFGSVVYRQSIGVEVWDVSSPMAPTLAGVLDESSASEGGLAITGGHLLSTNNTDSALWVYELGDPLRPRLMSTLPLPGASPMGIVAGERFAVIVAPLSEETELIGVELASFEAPRLAYRVTIAGRLPSSAIAGERLFVVMREHDPTRTWLEERVLGTGALVARHQLEEDGDAFPGGLAVHRGRLLRTTGGGVEILDVDGAEPVVVARHEVGEPYFGSVSVRGDRALVTGRALMVLDLSDLARPRELGRLDSPFSNALAMTADSEHAFVSNGNGLTPLDLRCE